MAAGSKAATAQGTRKTVAAGGTMPSADASGVRDGALEDVPAEPAPGPVSPRRPTIHGTEVSSLLLLLRQGEQAWMLGGISGNHEFARAFFTPKKEGEAPVYIVKDGNARVGGGIDLVHIAVGNDGATFSWSNGAKTLIPPDYYQITWAP